MTAIYLYPASPSTPLESPLIKSLIDAAKSDSENIQILVACKSQATTLKQHLSHHNLNRIPPIHSIDQFAQDQILPPQTSTLPRMAHLFAIFQNTPYKKGQLRHFSQLLHHIESQATNTAPFLNKHLNPPQKRPPLRQRLQTAQNKLKDLRKESHLKKMAHIQPKDLNKIQPKNLYIIGIHHIDNYQKPLLAHLITHAKSCSILSHHRPNAIHHALTSPLIDWLHSLEVNIRSLPQENSPQNHAPTLWKFNTQEDEMRHIAKHCRQLLDSDSTLTSNDIGLLLPESQSYQTINTYLNEENLHIQTPAPKLSTHPFALWLQHTLALAHPPFSPQELIRLVEMESSQNLGLSAPFLKNIASQFPNLNTPQKWHQAINQHTTYLEKSLERPSENDPTILQNKIDQSQKQYQALETLLTTLNTIQAATTASQIVQELRPVLLTLSPIKTLDTPKDHHIYRLQNDHHFFKSLSKIAEEIDQTHPTVSIKKLPKLLELALDAISQLPAPQPYETLEKLSTQTLTLNPPKHCFVLGFTNTQWPPKESENCFCPNSRLTPYSKKENSQFILFNLLESAHSITLCAPKRIGKESQNKSSFLDEISAHYNFIITPTTPNLFQDTSKETHLSETQPATQESLFNVISPTPLNTPHTAPNAFLSKSNQEKIKTHLNTTAFSATQLETYQKCPYYFYLNRILKEDPIEHLTEDIKHNTWGQFIHTILQDFNTLLAQKNIAITHKTKAQCLDHLKQITQKHYQKTAQNTLYWQSKYALLMGQDDTPGLWQHYIQKEADDDTPLTPVKSEWAFTLTLKNNSDTLNLKGSIDLCLENNAQWVVVDYKTGKALPSTADIAHFRHLQLPIYQAYLKSLQKKEVAGAIIYQIRHQDQIEKNILTSTKPAKKDLFKLQKKRPHIIEDSFYTQLKRHLFKLKTLIENGVFQAEPIEELAHMKQARKQQCSYCPYWANCTYEARFSP